MTRIEELKEEVRLLERIIELRHQMWTRPYNPQPYFIPTQPTFPWYGGGTTFTASGYVDSTNGGVVSNGTISVSG